MSQKEKSLNKAIVYILIGVIVLSTLFAVMMFAPRTGPRRSLFNTTLRYSTRGTEKLYYGEYASSIVQDIKDIGIDVSKYAMDPTDFIDRVILNKEYDIAIVEVEGRGAPHLESFFIEGGSLNIFNFRDNIDNGITTSYISNIRNETNISIRKNLFYELQEHLMTNILAMVPLFTPVRTFSYWDNLEGFSASLGLSNSIPYMSFNGLHSSQSSTTELKVGVGKWFDLNPLTMVESAEKIIVSLIMDKMIEPDTKGNPTKFGLIDNWEYLNDTTLLLHVRNNIKWQPDVDGLFTNEYFSVEDVIFTIDLLKSGYANFNYELYDWIRSYEAYNATTLAISIDSNTTTIVQEPYAFALEDLTMYPFPEHYLNVETSVQEIVQSQRYAKFAASPFGTGKYVFQSEESTPDLAAVLNKFDDWHGVGILPGKPTSLVFETIETQTMDDFYSMTLQLQDGSEIDFADFGKDPAMKDTLPTTGFETQYALDNSIIFLAFNLDNTIFGAENNFIPTNETGVSKGLAIRKALASIVDKTFMNEAYHNGFYNVSDTPVSRYFSDYYYQSVSKYDYSIEEALSYLKLAGFNVSVNSGDLNVDVSFEFAGSFSAVGIISIILTLVKRKKKMRVKI